MKLTRRRFLITGALVGGGLLAGWYWLPDDDRLGDPERLPVDPGEVALNGWLKIGRDGRVTVMVPRSEMGQGVYTALAMLVAEELEVPWEQVAVAQAPLDPIYTNYTILLDGLPYGEDARGLVPSVVRWSTRQFGRVMGIQATGGSTSVRDAWLPMRLAGATARHMLIDAAARDWGVDPARCRAEGGKVLHPDGGRQTGYGDLADRAARLTPPEAVRLKEPAQFRLLGTPAPRLDTPAKCDGTARFGMDIRPQGLLYAALNLCPVPGGTVKSVDAGAVRRRPGITAVVELPEGVAVVADSWWRAMTAAEALAVEFDLGPNAGLSSDDLFRDYAAALDRNEGRVYRDDGDAPAVLAQASRTLQAEYRVPFLAHACMEPMNCTALVEADRVIVWAPSQAPSLVRWIAAKTADRDEAQVTVHTPLLGGGFGRRAEMDLIVQAVSIARQVPGRPVQLIWSREQDIRHDRYRPAVLSRLWAALDDAGRPLAWRHVGAGPSVARSFTRRLLPWAALDMPDKTNVDGAAELPYAIPHVRVEYTALDSPVPVGFWRSVGHSQNAFFTEGFMDELARAAGQDPLDYRLALLEGHPRHRKVLEAVAELSGWRDGGLPPGQGLGVALHASFGSIVAQVARVSRDQGRVRVHEVWCVVDCGQVVNPDTVTAQMEGGIGFGLSAALYGEITLKDGRVEQSNFPDYPVVGMADMPRITVRIIADGHAPGGIGEVAVPPIAPAVVNALYAATGERVRALPLG